MMKVLIVTLWGDCNLGNKLQNYALNKILKRHDVATTNMVIEERKKIKTQLKNIVKIILSYFGKQRYLSARYTGARSRVLKKFSDGYLENKIEIKAYSDVKKMDFDKFDFGITGSDQVWHNWTKTQDELEYFYLMFLPSDKRASFAASFGFDSFPERDYLTHKKGLSEMRMLSCRESGGKTLIKSIVEREADLIPDPTLCMSINEWDNIAEEPQKKPQSPFLLVYFLGVVDYEYQNMIDMIAKKNELVVIDIYNPKYKRLYLTSPSEFIWYVKNASFVCTDSFHATVFSILYKKRFLSFKRRQKNMDMMFDRIETLLSNTGLQNRVYSKSEHLKEEICFEQAEKYISKCRQVADEYIHRLCIAMNNK